MHHDYNSLPDMSICITILHHENILNRNEYPLSYESGAAHEEIVQNLSGFESSMILDLLLSNTPKGEQPGCKVKRFRYNI